METTEQPKLRDPNLYEMLRGISPEQFSAMKRVADTCSKIEFEEFLQASGPSVQMAAEDLGCWGPGPTTFNPDAPGPEEPA